MSSNNIQIKITIIPVILAGGSGTRLWPLSNKNFPKELLKLHGNKTLLQSTLLQVNAIPNLEKPFIIGNIKHKNVIIRQINSLKLKATPLLETKSLDTATSVAFAAKYALTQYENPLLLILPIDHFISDIHQFSKMIWSACKIARKKKLVIFGVNPKFPSIDYGYIKKGKKISGCSGFIVNRFMEKPNLKIATQYFNSKKYYINSGVGLFSATDFLEELSLHSKKIFSIIEKTKDIFLPKKDYTILNSHLMKKYKSISVDKAVLEKTKNCVVFPFKGKWHDLGNWNALYMLAKKDGSKNAITKNVFCFKTKNSYLYSTDKKLVTLNVSDLLVVVTNETVFVSKRGQEQNIKEMVHLLSLKEK